LIRTCISPNPTLAKNTAAFGETELLEYRVHRLLNDTREISNEWRMLYWQTATRKGIKGAAARETQVPTARGIIWRVIGLHWDNPSRWVNRQRFVIGAIIIAFSLEMPIEFVPLQVHGGGPNISRVIPHSAADHG
jgi:hypothetical protein